MSIAILIFATWRLTRFITADSITAPFRARAIRAGEWWEDLVTCPYCIGFWIGVVTVASLYLARVGGWETTWQWLMAPWALNAIVGALWTRVDPGPLD